MIKEKQTTTDRMKAGQVRAAQTWLAYAWPHRLTGYIGKHTEVHLHAGAAYSNAKRPFLKPGQPLFPDPTRQTNEAEWLDMKAGFQYVMWALIFSVWCLFTSLAEKSPVSGSQVRQGV